LAHREHDPPHSHAPVQSAIIFSSVRRIACSRRISSFIAASFASALRVTGPHS
jgi:hypothetical protein